MTLPPTDRKHSLTILTKDNKLYIVSTNTFNGIVKKVNEKYMSTKKGGNGISISSICITAEKYKGIAKFHNTDIEFCADVMLIIP